LVSWKAVRKGALRGFASVRLGRSLVINDCPVLVGSNGSAWATLPGKPVLDAEGRQKRDDRGKPVYTPMAEWSDKAVRSEFSDAVVAAVERGHPGDLQADAA
jgi:DNA-binding cell septation regulator SpoVG